MYPVDPSDPPPSVLPRALFRLPIFPLPSVQLFPGMLLPLHVFEPRYRALTRACLAKSEGARLMALPSLSLGDEEDGEGRPAVMAVCGVGEIVEHRAHPDGRFDILLRGIGRIRIISELPPDAPFRLVSAVRLDDKPTSTTAVSSSMKSLTALCDRLSTVLPQGGDTLRQLVRQESEPGRACDIIAGALLTEPEDRQMVLEMLDVPTRLDHLTTAVAALIARFQTSGKSQARSN